MTREDVDPSCDVVGVCEALEGAAPSDGITMCTHCGKTLLWRTRAEGPEGEAPGWFTWDAPPGGGLRQHG
jgi:hypothetical protein